MIIVEDHLREALLDTTVVGKDRQDLLSYLLDTSCAEYMLDVLNWFDNGAKSPLILDEKGGKIDIWKVIESAES